MLTKEQKYMINESKMNTSMIFLFITIFSMMFIFFMLDLNNIIVQVVSTLLIVLEMFYMFHQFKLNKTQDKLLKEINEVD